MKVGSKCLGEDGANTQCIALAFVLIVVEDTLHWAEHAGSMWLVP
jgi:hypothetical protein